MRDKMERLFSLEAAGVLREKVTPIRRCSDLSVWTFEVLKPSLLPSCFQEEYRENGFLSVQW